MIEDLFPIYREKGQARWYFGLWEGQHDIYTIETKEDFLDEIARH